MQGCSTATTLEAVVGEVGIFVSCAVKSKIITLERMKKMKSDAIWHFDNKIGMDGLECFPGIRVENIKPQGSGLSSQSRA